MYLSAEPAFLHSAYKMKRGTRRGMVCELLELGTQLCILAVLCVVIAVLDHAEFTAAPASGADVLQWAFESYCTNSIPYSGCTGCWEMLGPPDAGEGCGFTCSAAYLPMWINDSRAAVQGASPSNRSVNVVVEFPWAVDSRKPLLFSLVESWNTGAGFVSRVDLVESYSSSSGPGDVVLSWKGEDTTCTCTQCACRAQYCHLTAWCVPRAACGGTFNVSNWTVVSDSTHAIVAADIYIRDVWEPGRPTAPVAIDAVSLAGTLAYESTPWFSVVCQAVVGTAVFAFTIFQGFFLVTAAQNGDDVGFHPLPIEKDFRDCHKLHRAVSAALCFAMLTALTSTLPFELSGGYWGQYMALSWHPPGFLIVYIALVWWATAAWTVDWVTAQREKHGPRVMVHLTRAAGAPPSHVARHPWLLFHPGNRPGHFALRCDNSARSWCLDRNGRRGVGVAAAVGVRVGAGQSSAPCPFAVPLLPTWQQVAASGLQGVRPPG